MRTKNILGYEFSLLPKEGASAPETERKRKKRNSEHVGSASGVITIEAAFAIPDTESKGAIGFGCSAIRRVGIGRRRFIKFLKGRFALVLGIFQHLLEQIAKVGDFFSGQESSSPENRLWTYLNYVVRYYTGEEGSCKVIINKVVTGSWRKSPQKNGMLF